jgi:hypothetical protein
MDDVVSAFVSQYENNLYAKKKDLTHDIKLIEGQVVDNTRAVLKVVTGNEYTKESLPFGLKLQIDKGVIDWEDGEVSFSLTIKKHSQSSYGNTISLNKIKKVPAANRKAYKALTAELQELRSDLSEVLVSLKSVTRKERQVRGRIAIRKLEDSGYGNLMNDKELVKLVQLED